MKLLSPLLLAGVLGVAGCGLDPAKIATHEVYASASAEVEQRPYLRFAVVGGTAGPLGAEVVEDLRQEMPLRGFQFVALTGNYVDASSNPSWSLFDDRWKNVLEGQTLGETKVRVPAVPLAGRSEYSGDSDLVGYGAAFPGVGKNIGYNRTASWGHFDVPVDDQTWRFVYLDGRKSQMGSRWKEQSFWLERIMEDQGYDQLVLFINEPLATLGRSSKMDPGDGPSELLEMVNDLSGVLALRAVFFGGTGTNEMFLHNGNFGEAHVVAGTAGWKTEPVDRWGAADEAGLKDIGHEPMFSLSLVKEFDLWNEALGFSEVTVDKAKGSGSFEGFTATIEDSAMPIVGWWHVEIDDGELRLIFRMRRYDGSFNDIWSARHTEQDGWKTKVGAP